MTFSDHDVSTLVLAGGRGERLDLLTGRRAKPAVPFGGTLRLIDVVLSNCFHSGLDDVSILTQYLPRSLEDHVGFGRPWDLDRLRGGVNYMHPFRGLTGSNWYGGTANALFENLSFLEESRARHFLILSGDHVYRMDYRQLLRDHTESGAAVSVAVRPVAADLACQFGIFESDESGRALRFEEKPARPKSNLASMGIYVIDRDFLLSVLRERGPREPALDFGRDLIPGWVSNGQVALSPFDGYWVDVGTLDSYYSAHLDLLGDNPVFSLFDAHWPLMTRNQQRAPLSLGHGAVAEQSLVAEGCRLKGKVSGSVLGPGVSVEPGAEVIDSIVMEDSVIGEGARVQRCIVDKRVIVGRQCRLGGESGGHHNLERPEALRSGLTLLAKDSRVPDGLTLGRNVRWRGEADSRLFPGGEIVDGSSVLGT